MRLALTSGGRISAENVRRDLGRAAEDGLFSSALLRSRPLEALLAHLEREYLVQLFRDSGGDLEDTARKLGITRRALYVRLRKLRIRPKDLKKQL